MGYAPVALVVDSTRQLIYVVNRDSRDVTVVDVTDPRAPAVRARLTVGKDPHGIDFLSAASKLYVTNSGSDTVSVLLIRPDGTLGLLSTIHVGHRPSGIALVPPTGFSTAPLAYVANRESDTVSVIETATDRVIAIIPVGVDPIDVTVGELPTARQ